MRAWMLSGYGSIDDKLRLQSVAMPEPAADELRVRVSATSINPIDCKLLEGKLRAVQPLRFPVCPGFDVAGVVDAVGTKVRGFQLGDAVYARSDRRRLGAFAEYVCLQADWVAQQPPGLSAEQAAALPLVGLTCVQGLLDRAGAKPGQSILIHAGSGGVGSFALQYAKALELQITTTCSSRNEALALSLGADRVLCYDKVDYRQDAQRYDIVYDLLGGQHTLAAFDLLKPGGCVVSIAGPPDRDFARQVAAGWLLRLLIPLRASRIWRRAERGGFRYFRFLTEPSGHQLGAIAALVARGAIAPLIDSVHAFEQLPAAMKRCAEGHSRGKIVVRLNPT